MERAGGAPRVSSISLDGPSVRLRPITRADYGFLWQCRSHMDILYLWMQGRALPSFEQYAQELDTSLAGQILTMLLIETQAEQAPVGYVFAYEFSAYDNTAFFNIVIHPNYVRHGWAAEAGVLFLNYLFTYFDLRKVSMEVFAFNTLVLDPLVQLGAKAEGRFLGQRYYQGTYHDVIRLAITHEDWNRVAPMVTSMLASLRSGAGAPPLAPEASVATEVEVVETLVELAADRNAQAGDVAALPTAEPVASNGHHGRPRRAKPRDAPEAD